MSAVFSFLTPRFDQVDEPPNPVRPVIGYALLAWVAERLLALGLVKDADVEAEDSGWYVDVDVFGEPYRIAGRGDDVGGDAPAGADRVSPRAWTLNVSPRRSIIDRLLGRRELAADNALLRILLEILERQPDFSSIELVVK